MAGAQPPIGAAVHEPYLHRHGAQRRGDQLFRAWHCVATRRDDTFLAAVFPVRSGTFRVNEQPPHPACAYDAAGDLWRDFPVHSNLGHREHRGDHRV